MPKPRAIDFITRCERDFRMSAREMQVRRKLHRYRTSLIDRRQWKDVPQKKRDEVNAEITRLDNSLKKRADRIRKHLIEETLATEAMDDLLAMRPRDAYLKSGFTLLVRDYIKNVREQKREEARERESA